MFSWVIWFPAPGSIPADVIKTTEPWWVYESGRSNVSTAKAWESLLGRGSRTVTSIIVKSSVHSFISRWIRLRFGMRKGARNRDNAFALYAKWLSQPRKWNCSLRKVAIATAMTKLLTAQRVSQPRKWNCSLRKVAIATAMTKLLIVQSGYRNRDSEIVHCARGLTTAIAKLLIAQSDYRNRDSEIVHCARGLASAMTKLLTAQSDYRNRDSEIVHCARGYLQWRGYGLK